MQNRVESAHVREGSPDRTCKKALKKYPTKESHL